MKFHVARQPIFTQRLKVYGYELLYRRTNRENFYNPLPHIDGDEATSNVIINSFYNIGIDEMTAGRKAFINFTGNILSQEIATLFPSNILVVEILESVAGTDEVVARCKELRDMGYEIALDDFVLQPENAALLPVADIVKIDFMQSSEDQIRYVMRKAPKGIRYLAEKIETREMYETAVNMGFQLFQGYFFSKPIIVTGESLRPVSVNCLRLLQIVNRPDFSFHSVAQIVMQDVSLSYQLLKLVNSVAFGFTVKIKTIRHALVVLGTREVRKWVSLVSMMGISEGQPRELNRLSLTRAKFCEYLGRRVGGVDVSDVFMTGLFSLLDVMMGKPFDEIFRDISVSDELRDALEDGKGPHRPYVDLIIAYEKGEWENVDEIAAALGTNADIAADAYQEALVWTNELVGYD